MEVSRVDCNVRSLGDVLPLIRSASLAGGQQIRSLQLHSNNIARIDVATVQQLAALTMLDLSSNAIVSMRGVESLRCLQVLNLANNRITQIEALETLTAIRRLDLSYNRISSLVGLVHLHGTQQHASSLEYLDVRGNQITALPELYYLTGLNKLRHLFLADPFQNEDSISHTNGVHLMDGYKGLVHRICPLLTSLDGLDALGHPVEGCMLHIHQTPEIIHLLTCKSIDSTVFDVVNLTDLYPSSSTKPALSYTASTLLPKVLPSPVSMQPLLSQVSLPQQQSQNNNETSTQPVTSPALPADRRLEHIENAIEKLAIVLSTQLGPPISVPNNSSLSTGQQTTTGSDVPKLSSIQRAFVEQQSVQRLQREMDALRDRLDEHMHQLTSQNTDGESDNGDVRLDDETASEAENTHEINADELKQWKKRRVKVFTSARKGTVTAGERAQVKDSQRPIRAVAKAVVIRSSKEPVKPNFTAMPNQVKSVEEHVAAEKTTTENNMLAQLDSEMERIRSNEVALTDELKRNTAVVEQHRQSLNVEIQRRHILEGLLREAEITIRSMKQRYELLQNETKAALLRDQKMVSQLSSALDVLEQRNSQQTVELEHACQHIKKFEGMQAQGEEKLQAAELTKSKMSENMLRERAALKNRLLHSTRQVAALQAAVQQLSREGYANRFALTASESALSQAHQRSLADADARVKREIEVITKALRRQHTDALSLLQEKLDTSLAAYDALEGELRRVTTDDRLKYATIETSLQQSTAALSEQRQQIKILQSREQAQNLLVRDLSGVVNDQKREIADITEQLKDCQTVYDERLRQMEAKVTQSAKYKMDLRAAKKDHEALQTLVVKQESEIQRHNADLARIRDLHVNEIMQKNEETVRLQCQLDQLVQNKSKLEVDQKALQDTVRVKDKMLDDQNESIRRLKRALTTVNNEYKTLQNKQDQDYRLWEEQRANSENTLRDLQYQVDVYERTIEQLQVLIEEHRCERDTARDQASELSDKLNERNIAIRTIENEVSKVKTMMQTKEASLAKHYELESHKRDDLIVELKGALETSQNKLRHLEYEHGNTIQELFKINKELQLSSQENKQYKAELHTLQSELDTQRQIMSKRWNRLKEAMSEE